ncbi:MAG TPA: response regulator, partial [Luteibaculaceae bacterium]|nr:response regulator [Luteibaculaceae bacterium]
VRDTGVGIPADKLDQIFERFVQASSETTRNYGGSGLGLSIVRSLVEALGGTISASSVEGLGSEFMVTLPFHLVDPDEGTETQMIDAAMEDTLFPGISILLVEDNRLNQLVAIEMFKRLGCSVDLAENGGVAIEMVKVKRFDLIFMDIQMPIIDGYSAAQEIHTVLGIDTPIVAMTAHVLPGERERCLSYGMSDYISKPFTREQLVKVISGHLQAKRKD